MLAIKAIKVALADKNLQYEVVTSFFLDNSPTIFHAPVPLKKGSIPTFIPFSTRYFDRAPSFLILL
jgi:hypothetical protein